MRKLISFTLFYVVFTQILTAQTHNAIHLQDPVYHIIETAQIKGIIGILPVAKPYSRFFILKLIDEMLDFEAGAGGLTDAERSILESHKTRLTPKRDGFDLARGAISGEHEINGNYFSYEFGFGMDIALAGSIYPIAGGYEYSEGDDLSFKGAGHAKPSGVYGAIDMGIPHLSFTGDLGRNNSYGLTLIGRLVQNPRAILGRGRNIYDAFDPDEKRQITIFNEPAAYFPYTYKKRWDGFVWPIGGVSSHGMTAWPNEFSVGYTMIPEFSGVFLDGAVSYRIARLDREWTGMAAGSSLVLNSRAQSFLAGEITIKPFSWITISSLTGVLEFHNAIGINPDSPNDAELKKASETFQNAFSIVMLELNYKNYFHIDFGTSAIWPKRLEIGYPFPFAENLLYQNNIGDYDNLGLFLNVLGNYPGIGKAWASLFLDEINISESAIFDKDRSMFAFQAGGSVNVKWLPFTTVMFSYTKVEPYVYTHTRDKTPWYGELDMETNYVNQGRSLGHYLPPNSDEFLLRIDAMPIAPVKFGFQYQLIRHGAEYGNRAPDGSSLWSELDPDPVNRSELYKFFLRDGAYKWANIFKLSAEYSLVEKKIPLKFFAEAGTVYSYFTDIDGDVNGKTPSPYYRIDTPQYPIELYFIASLGITLFPK